MMINSATSSEKLKFRSGKSRRTALFIWVPTTFVLVSLLCLLLNAQENRGILFTSGIYLIIYFSLVWMWFDTGYEISETELCYHSGFMKGKIAISGIRKIEKKQELFGGLKPALGSQGILVHYNKFDDIFLSPENQDAFIQELIQRNPAIALER